MAKELPEEKQALPVLKVLYRNSNRIGEKGGRKAEVLKPVAPATLPEDRKGADVLLAAVKRKDTVAAEKTFAALAACSPEDAFNNLLVTVQDGLDVHRIVLPYRAWDLLPIIGREHAHTMLRQSVRYCVKDESPRYSADFAEPRALLPKLLDRYKLPRAKPGKRSADDAWVEKMSQTIFKGPAARSAEAVAAALAEGCSARPSARPFRWRPMNSSCATTAGRRDRPAPEAGRQRPRRLDWRPRQRLGQRLAQHGSG